jgi:ABC-type transport system involved in multi-copper enzyme maturation permease subunit
MTWLAWRQLRPSAVATFGALLALAVALAVTGPQLVHVYDTTVKPCPSIGDCSDAITAFGNKYNVLQQLLTIVMQVAPALLGLFWGAPLVARELETGTYKLAWTQSVTRTRWLATKLAVTALATGALAGLLSLAVTWWSAPLDKVGTNRFDGSVFGERGITPIGYALFAFAVGALLGLLIRRTLPAMAATLVAFIAVRLVFSQLIRPHLMTPLRATFTLLATVNGYASFNGSTSNLTAGSPSDASLQNAWIYSARIVDAAGRALTPQATASACPQLANGGLRAQLPPAGSAGHVHAVPTQAAGQALQQCVTKLSDSYHTILSYQPANRYWTFQALETAIFAALAICLAGVALWNLRKHLS